MLTCLIIVLIFDILILFIFLFEVVFIFEIIFLVTILFNIDPCRKSDGRKYSEGVASIKDAEFPFPAPAALEVEDAASIEVVKDCCSEEIAILQERLHEALAQLELSNSECVDLAQENVGLKAELKVAEDKSKKLATENSVLRRRLSEHYPDIEGPAKPGPTRKSFENLTPRIQKRASDDLQAHVLKTSAERGIPPQKLSAFLTYR